MDWYTDMWQVLPEAAREQWDYLPGRALGPLCLGMHRDDAGEALAAHGFTAAHEDFPQGLERIRFAHTNTPTSFTALDCYFREEGQLAYVQIDVRFGPQVTCQGIRLIGRVPSQLAEEMEGHAAKCDTGLMFGPTGDCACKDFQLSLGAQRAGDHTVSWALFFHAGEDYSNTLDGVPETAWHRW